MRTKILLTLLAFAAAVPAPALAQACKAPQMLASVQMQPNADRTREFVPVTINGVDKRLLLDTGGYLTQLSLDSVYQMKLPQRPGVNLQDMSGHVWGKVVTLDTLQIGNMRARNIEVQVIPTPSLTTKLHADGLLAPDLMYAYDMDIDFGSDQLKFFVQDHCEGPPDEWQGSAAAVIPFTIDSGHIILQVTLDGYPVRAFMDTGAPHGTVGRRTAYKMGLNEGEQNKETSCFEHKFGAVSFGGVTVSNITMPLIGSETEASVGAKADMLLGMNALRKLHIYIAFKERKLYVTGATPQPVPADAPVPEAGKCERRYER